MGALGSLSAREREVLAALAEGLTNRELADRLFISERTANRHLSNIFVKLGVRNRTRSGAGRARRRPGLTTGLRGSLHRRMERRTDAVPLVRRTVGGMHTTTTTTLTRPTSLGEETAGTVPSPGCPPRHPRPLPDATTSPSWSRRVG